MSLKKRFMTGLGASILYILEQDALNLIPLEPGQSRRFEGYIFYNETLGLRVIGLHTARVYMDGERVDLSRWDRAMIHWKCSEIIHDRERARHQKKPRSWHDRLLKQRIQQYK